VGIPAQERSLQACSGSASLLIEHAELKLAPQATEGDALKEPEPGYFDELKSRLDLVLAFTEHGM